MKENFKLWKVIIDNIDVYRFKSTQTAQDVKTTLFWRSYDVKTVKERRSNVALTSCVPDVKDILPI